MATVYNQAMAHRFGVALAEFLESGEWTYFEAAVAWVRRSGTRHLLPSLRKFLANGGESRVTVGVDIENTSREGLEDLLSLGKVGNFRTFVHHNESSSVTFHPKVYLFGNAINARLLIGSNNLTESGLFTNTEVSLQIDVPANDPVVIDIRKALSAWRDTADGLAKELDAGLLEELAQKRYVFTEQVLRKRRLENEKSRSAGLETRTLKKLFGTKTVTAPLPPEAPLPVTSNEISESKKLPKRIAGILKVPGYPHPVMVTNVVLMKIRPARGTQVQLPIPLRESAFFKGASEIMSGHDNVTRVISATHPKRAKGAVNTYKVEIPETRGMATPVMRLDRSSAGIVYYAYDANSTQGQPIWDSLNTGRLDTPPSTVLTKPADPNSAQWYRFI